MAACAGLLTCRAMNRADAYAAFSLSTLTKGTLRQPVLLHRPRVQPVVDVDDGDTRILRGLQHRHQPLGVPGRDDDGIHLGADQLLDNLDLLLDGGLLRGRLHQQLDAQLLLRPASAPLHLHEERVGERLHHQRHLPDGGGGRRAGVRILRRRDDPLHRRLASVAARRQSQSQDQEPPHTSRETQGGLSSKTRVQDALPRGAILRPLRADPVCPYPPGYVSPAMPKDVQEGRGRLVGSGIKRAMAHKPSPRLPGVVSSRPSSSGADRG